nr:transglycosylase SLT domain-containing protein [Streptococcus entericus]
MSQLNHKNLKTRLLSVLSAFSILVFGLLLTKLFGQELPSTIALADTQKVTSSQSEKDLFLTTLPPQLKLAEPKVSIKIKPTEPEVIAEEPVVESVEVVSESAVQFTPVVSTYTAGSYPTVLSNGNTAGAVGTEAAARMAAATGVPQATWEYIIARESNGNPNVANASGASGLFQTMPGWGSTATVDDQINSALNAYNNQGLAAWGVQ